LPSNRNEDQIGFAVASNRNEDQILRVVGQQPQGGLDLD
jgi:hypothetical protein